MNNYDETDEFLNGKSKKLSIIFAIFSFGCFILAIIVKNILLLSLLLFLISFIFSEVGIKYSKRYNLKLWKIVNSILGVVSIVCFVLLLFNVIGTIAVRDKIIDLWPN